MPTPDVVAEFVVGNTCPPSDDLDRLSEQLASAFLPSLTAGRKSLALCALRPAIGANVVSIGIWGETNGFSDNVLREALAEVNLSIPGRTAALLITAEAIQQVATVVWAASPKKIGRVTFDEAIDVQVGSNGIVTKVSGTFDVPLFFDIDFTYTIRDQISLTAPGSTPPLAVESSTDLDTDSPGTIAASLIAGLLHPILGAIVVFSPDEIAERIAESNVPNSPGVGSQLASQWPSQILTEIRPPFLPGKFTLAWNDLIVDERGILARGTFAPATRAPRVTVLGPRSVSIREALGHARATFRVDIRDLRKPLAIQWSGGGQSSGGGQEMSNTVSFFSAGRVEVRASVRDADGLSATDGITVAVSITPLEPGQQPF